MFTKEFFRGLSIEVMKKYRKHIFEDGKDVNDKKFKEYK